MVTVDRSSPPSTKTRTLWRVVTVPDHTWERSGTTVVSTQIQTGFIVGGADGTLCCWSGVGPVEGLGLLPEEHQHEGPSCAEDLQDRVTAEYHHQSESVSVRAADSLLLQMFPSVCCCN